MKDMKYDAAGVLTALFDSRSFVPLGARQRPLGEGERPASDGLLAGYGAIGGKLAFAFAQDPAVAGGALGASHAKKIARIYENAKKSGAPVIGILGSSGVRLSEGLWAFDALGAVIRASQSAKGLVPRITLLLGNAAGSSAVLPAMSDFVFAKKGARSFLSPEEANLEPSANRYFESESEMLAYVRTLIGLLPLNSASCADMESMDDINRAVSELSVPGHSAESIISFCADAGSALFINESAPDGAALGFARFGGISAGILGTMGENISAKALLEAARLVEFCSRFRLPIVSFSGASGFKGEGAAEAAARLALAFAASKTPRVNIIFKKASGGAYLFFNSIHLGADVQYVWESAELGLISSEAAIDVLYADSLSGAADIESAREAAIEKYRERVSSPIKAAEDGFADDVISPVDSRRYIISALEMLWAKREV
ncbi:MAG: hypothetical protein IJC39_02470 [Firmicutes bacterium]|nr:hypothetical protein [Bacillota bacterium]